MAIVTTTKFVTTTKGNMDAALLTKQTGLKNDHVEETSWDEYWLGGKPGCKHAFEHDGPQKADGSRDCTKGGGAELVHRSIQMRLKKNVVADGVAAMLK